SQNGSEEASWGGTEGGNWRGERKQTNHRMNPTWLIGALFEFLTRIGVGWLAKVLTPQPPSGLCGCR
ncbi:hypothetical protein M1N50_01870, partial [Dehalococcoidia bacterium]|nr:hypothetical protein [Dehalococcoidia bacterium]